MSDLKYHETIWAEMSPDPYGGENCDEIVPRWRAFAEGYKDAYYTDNFDLFAKKFPPGTKVVVSLPCCPECSQTPELCRADETCIFDWDFWIECQYS